jgi:hypothetical protein
MGRLLGVAVMFAVGMLIDLYTAWVLVVLWGWFVTPTFAVGAPPVLAMWGIYLLVGRAARQFVPTPEAKPDAPWWGGAVGASLDGLLATSITWGAAALVHYLFQ